LVGVTDFFSSIVTSLCVVLQRKKRFGFHPIFSHSFLPEKKSRLIRAAYAAVAAWYIRQPIHRVEKYQMEMVFCYQNCSDLLLEKIVLVIEKKLLKFEAEGREFEFFLRLLEQFIQTVKGQNNFW
jgi:hypothetical protein